MTIAHGQSGDAMPFALPELMAEYLRRQASAHEAGVGLTDAAGEVTPYEAVPVQPVEPRVAWHEAGAAIRCFQGEEATDSWQAPMDWSGLVASHEPAAALAFSAGNFPQLVREIHTLIMTSDLSTLRPQMRPALSAPGLAAWAAGFLARKQFPQALLAIGTLRLARQFEEAEELLNSRRQAVPSTLQPAWANEEAALTWHHGDAERALAMWQTQPASAPVLFNQGMAALVLGRAAEARSPLSRAVSQLSDENGWHHLGKLYLALAEMKM
jgi:hypothetical protein